MRWKWKCPRSAAEFARERIRLERMREEIRAEADRVQREAGVRENLAPVNKLREEINQKKNAKVNDRLQTMR